MRIIICILMCNGLWAQYDHRSVFADKEGTLLYDALVENYKPDFVLDLDEAKDTLYRHIYLHDDSVRCVYSGLTKYLDLSQDPSQALFGNGNNTDINLEHSYPRGKGADSGNALSDMHHLFPTRVPVNTARASEPFREIPDNSATAWYYREETRSTPPALNREKYAEDTADGFEPRDDFMGNVARAAFYFYTMYRDRAEAADPEFFQNQRATLCAWHEQDPVDSLEWVRNARIAHFQDGKENPFVLDCRLARLYCNDISAPCRAVGVESVTSETYYTPIVEPDIILRGDILYLKDTHADDKGSIQIIDQLGRTCLTKDISSAGIDADLPGGIFIILKLDEKGQLVATQRLIVM